MQVVNYIILGASFITAVTTICAVLKKVINKGFEPFPLDLWSCGICLYIMLSGTIPFQIKQCTLYF